MRNKIIENKKLILKLIGENITKSEICRIIDCRPSTLDRYLKLMNINYKGNRGRKGFKHNEIRKPASYYLVKNKSTGSHKLKIKIIEDGIKEHKCEKCGLYEWLGEPIPLELHHVNGDRFNNELVNLEILCPNCHSKTENNSGKGRKNKTKSKRIRLNTYIKKGRIKKIYFCDCGKEILRQSKMCEECWQHKQRRTERPTKEQLLLEISNLGYCGVGRKYGVSDNAIRKWIK